ncbi:MAG: hypothetical protein E7246_00910 [Lachnoclostridium sp.]|nr:hypothetical protein [Lachnoclostridium sp.]
MNYNSFENSFYDALVNAMEPRGCTLTKTMIHRNNEDLAGIVICRDFTHVGIVIYPKDRYEEWKKGLSMEELILGIREDVLFKKMSALDIQSFDAEQAAKKLMACVVGYERNKEWLQHIPHQRVEDMALYAKWCVEDDTSLVVSKEIMGQLRMTKEEMLGMATENLRRTANFYPLENFIFGFDDISIYQREFNGSFDRSIVGTANPMYLLGSSRGLQGAAVALDPVVMKAVHECLDSDFYMLPSSIHETIIIPTKEWKHGVDVLRNMVRSVNAENVPMQDQLTDNVYYCDGHKLKLAGAEQKMTVGTSMEGHKHRR